MGGARPSARENGQIRPSNAIWDAWKAGSRRTSNLGFQRVQKTPIIHASSGGILGNPGLFNERNPAPLYEQMVRLGIFDPDQRVETDGWGVHTLEQRRL
jgi:hypothetical protein